MHRHRSKIFYKLNLPICVYIQPQNRSGLFLVLGPQYFRGPWRWRKSSNGNGRAIKVLFLIGFLVLSANNACWVPLPVLVIVPVLILVPVLVPECQSLLFWVKHWDEQPCLCSSASNNTLIQCISKLSNLNLRRAKWETKYFCWFSLSPHTFGSTQEKSQRWGLAYFQPVHWLRPTNVIGDAKIKVDVQK